MVLGYATRAAELPGTGGVVGHTSSNLGMGLQLRGVAPAAEAFISVEPRHSMSETREPRCWKLMNPTSSTSFCKHVPFRK